MESSDPVLYSAGAPIGLLKSFSPNASYLEVDVVVPYSGQEMPGIGEFLLVELGPTDALVGRVSRFAVAGHLTSLQGDAYLADLAKTADTPPPAIMRQMLRYNMKMSLLGQLRICPSGGGPSFQFLVGERAFVSLGRPVRRPSDAALAYLCNVGLEDDPSAAVLGYLSYGQKVLETVPVRFSVDRLKGRRSFVFARAGYGKSNLMKYLISQLYSTPPDVGLLIFDPEGEYALPDAEGRPGLINVPQLRDRISYYTNRAVSSQYASIKKGEAYIDFGDFPPQDIVASFVAQEKQEMVFANQLRSLEWSNWRALVELLATKKHQTSDSEVAEATKIRIRRDKDKDGDVIVSAIRNNLIPPISRLHRNGATLSKDVIGELKAGRVVIVDTSLLGSEDALSISGLVLHRIFNHNKRHFTEPVGSTVRCLTVIEEAQTVLGDRQLDDRNIFVRWVKEGRKYSLGCVLVTQQPGAIADQIISQGDNFFVMHLLNEADLRTLSRHNGHYSDDILSFIRNEPIKGNCYFWTAPDQPFVLPARVADFASVANVTEPRSAASARSSVPETELQEHVGRHAMEALSMDARVWVYPVVANGQRQAFVAFSQEYLNKAVAARLQRDGHLPPSDDAQDWLGTKLPRLVETTMAGLSAKAGQAVLASRRQPVWVVPESKVSLGDGKTVQTQTVEVT
jgi:hypothetical protein